MKYLVFFVSLVFSGTLLADGHIKYIKNEGQWNSHILFKAPIQSGELYLENNRLTYSFYDAEKSHELHHLKHENTDFDPNDYFIEGHAFNVEFVGANNTPSINGNQKLTEYYNYFIGNKSENWKGRVPLFEQVRYQSIYEDIDLLLYSQNEFLKYDFIIKPNGNPENIQLDYQGVQISLINESIHIPLGFNTVIEQKPYAYQLINGEKTQVACEYKLENNMVNFHFPEGYDKNLELVIDPILVVATYSGSTQTGYGHSATYDNLGNIYTGEICFGTGYPVNTGAFQVPYGGGGQDIAISKLNPDGSALIWATYIGGDQGDSPQSLVVNNSGELYVFGTTSSTDYPTSANAFQTTMGGGWTDFVITHLTTDGTNLVGSTFLGGSGDETLIGEIIVDDFGNAYIASSTSSTDFPTSVSAFQSTWAGAGGGWGGTGIAFKLSPNMANLNWSTYLNSDGTAGARGLNLGSNETVYVIGTTEDGFFTTPGSSSPTLLGGQDVFVCQIDQNGSNLLASTYFGGTGFDTGIFLDVDIFGDVYITGTTDSNLPISTGCYGTTNSGVFISKLNPNLSNVVWQTTIGDGSGWSNFTPNAFMVDVCRKIYVGGFGAGGSDLFTTTDAFFDGSDWSEGYYMMSLEPNAISVNFASFFQGDHVDGGTSRFDPNGIVYQAVCSPNTITPTAGAYSTCLTGGYDEAVFKVDFQSTSVNALAEAGPSTAGCTPFEVNFTNNSTAVSFEWDFDDGPATSTEQNPSYTFNDPGSYQVMLIAIDSNSCNIRDTFYIPINVSIPDVEFDFSYNNGCEDSLIQFESIGATPADIFEWNFGDGSTSTAMNPSYAYPNSGTYDVELVVTSFCGADDTINYEVQIVPPPDLELGSNLMLCNGESVTLDASNPGCTYLWQDDSTDPTLEVTSSGIYSVTVSSVHCAVSDEATIDVDIFSVDAGDDLEFCAESFNVTLTASSGANSYLWSTGESTQSIEVNNPGTYQVSATSPNNCVYTDLVSITLNDLPQVALSSSSREECNPGYISFTDLSTIQDGDIMEWEWYFEGAENSTTTHPFTHWDTPGTFDVGLFVLTNNGCSDSILLNDYITINPSPQANFLTEPSTIDWCNPFLQFINTSTDYSRFIWDFGDSTSSQEISPYHLYEEASSYYVSLFVENDFDCKDSTAYTINPSDNIPFYVPNAFTPEKDGYNESFKAYSNCLKDYQMWVYSRWGELVFYSDDIENGWDGNFQNKECQTGVYSWKIKYHGGKANQVKTGSVTLLR